MAWIDSGQIDEFGSPIYTYVPDEPAPTTPAAPVRYGAQGPGSWVNGSWVPSTDDAAIEAFINQGGPQINQDTTDHRGGVNPTNKIGAQGNGRWVNGSYVPGEPDGYGGWIDTNKPPPPAAPVVDKRKQAMDKGYQTTVDYLRGLFHDDTKFDKYRPEINNELDLYGRANNGFAGVKDDEIDAIPTNYYGEGRAQSVYDTLLSRHRGQWGSQATQQFGVNRPNTDVPDTMDDEIINKILAEQRPNAEQQITFAQKRGQLNGTGYAKANERLNNKQTEAFSTLNTQGSTLLNALRGRLSTIGADARTGSQSADFNNEFDPSSFEGLYNSTLNEGKSGLEGSLRGMTTPDEFGIRDIIGYGGANQGTVNNPTFLLDAIQKQKKARDTSRGLGTTGEF